MAASTSRFLEQLILTTTHGKPTEHPTSQHSLRPRLSFCLFCSGAPPRTCAHPWLRNQQTQAERLREVPAPPPELSRARGGADEEVAAASPSANWFPGWQLRRGGSAGGSAGGAHGDGTRSRNAAGSRQGRPSQARPRRERARPCRGARGPRSPELRPAEPGLKYSAAHRLGGPDLATSTWDSCGQEGARGKGLWAPRLASCGVAAG